LGLVVAWAVYPVLSFLFFAPLNPVLKRIGGEIVFNSFTQGFMLQLQVSLVAGLVIAIPLVTFELWGFIAPGLTRNERRACYIVFPLSVFFFFMGIVCGYFLMSVTVDYFAQFIPKDAKLLQDPVKYIVFLVKMVVAFGVCFEMPVILMFLAYVGMVNSRVLREQWRMAVVGCFVVAAIATPGGDPLTMSIMAAPLAVLYVSSIFLVAFVEKVRSNQEKKALALDGVA
jgi:sec-independent protein translocase protein TatC